MEKEITVYEPNQRHKLGYFRIWKTIFGNLVNSKELIYQLFRRDFLMQYKKSFIGMGWLVLSPIVGIASWVFLNSAGILNAGDLDIPYPAFVLLSSSIFGLFMGFESSAAGTLDAGSGFIMQVKYPHEVLLVKQIAQQLSNFLITFVLNIVILLIFGVIPSWYIFLFPILVLPLFFLGSAIGLLMSLIGVVAIDFTKIFNTAFGFIMYITPVVYPLSAVENETLKIIMEWNPLTYLVGGVRDLIIYGEMQNLNLYLIFSACTFVIFLYVWRLFYVSEDRIIEKMF